MIDEVACAKSLVCLLQTCYHCHPFVAVFLALMEKKENGYWNEMSVVLLSPTSWVVSVSASVSASVAEAVAVDPEKADVQIVIVTVVNYWY